MDNYNLVFELLVLRIWGPITKLGKFRMTEREAEFEGHLNM